MAKKKSGPGRKPVKPAEKVILVGFYTKKHVIDSLGDEKIEAMMNYPTFYFKRENIMGIYRLSVDKKKIQAPDAETAQIMAGKDWVLITND